MDTPKVKLQLVITFPKDAELIAKVKRISGRRWDKVNQHWTAPLTFENVSELDKIGFELDVELQDWFTTKMEEE